MKIFDIWLPTLQVEDNQKTKNVRGKPQKNVIGLNTFTSKMMIKNYMHKSSCRTKTANVE